MRILFVLNRRPKHNTQLHGGFLQASRIVGIEPYFYGPSVEGTVGPARLFSKQRRFQSIVEDLKCELLVMYRAGHTGMDWVRTEDLQGLRVPSILIDVDFCYRRESRDWLHEAVDMHLLRHPADLEYSRSRNAGLLPFSIDPRVYRKGKLKNRSGICFSGRTKTSGRPDGYVIRRRALRALSPDVLESLVNPIEQVRYYHAHKAAMTCSAGPWRYINSKHFEIPATRTVLFTNGHNSIERYLPKGTYVTYRDDCKDIVDLWHEVDKNWSLWRRKADKASLYVHAHHTHLARWTEFVQLVEKDFGIRSAGNGSSKT